MRARKYLLVMVGVLVGWLSGHERAAACSWLLTAELAWPRPDAVDASTQPTIVIFRSPNLAIEAGLLDPSGQEVQLVARAAGPIAVSEYHAELVFLTPAAPLAENTRYQVTFRDPKRVYMPPPRSFTTGAAGKPEPAAPELELALYRARTDPDCRGSEAGCGDFLEVHLTGEVDDAKVPFWVRLSAAHAGGVQTRTVGLFGEFWPQTLLAIDAAAGCVSYERIDARGEIVVTGELCKPAKCANLARGVLAIWGIGCGPPGPLGASAWDLVEADSCAEPPWLRRLPDNSFELLSSAPPEDAATRDAALGAAPHANAGTPDASGGAAPPAVEEGVTPVGVLPPAQSETDPAVSAPSRHDDGCALAGPGSERALPPLWAWLLAALGLRTATPLRLGPPIRFRSTSPKGRASPR